MDDYETIKEQAEACCDELLEECYSLFKSAMWDPNLHCL